MDEQDFSSLVLYYGRARFFHSMQKMALDGLAKHPANASFRLYNGISLALGNRVQEGIRELNPLKNEPDLGLAATLGLIYAHKRCNLVDNDAVANLEAKLKEERKNLTANSAYYAAVFLFLNGKVEKAREYAEKALKINPELLNAHVLKAWTELSTDERLSKNILQSLDKVLQKGKNIDASLGQVKYFQLNSDYENAISVLNKLSVRFPELNIPLIEKMETQLASWNWDYAFETALRIVNLEPSNISALRVKGFLLVCKEGNIQAGVQTLQQLLNATERVEMGNYSLILQICQLFSRICGRQKDVLNITNKYVDKIVQLSPGNVEFLTELGYQFILMGNYKEATKCFRSATKVDDNLFFALCGLTLCQIIENGVTEQVRQQVEFLNEMKGINKEPILLLLSSKIAENGDKAVALLIEATEIHFKNLKTLSFGAEYLLRFDPDFLLQLTEELMQHSPVQVQVKVGVNLTKDTLHMSLKHCLNILEAVCKACPGSVKAIFLMAKVEFLCGEISSSTTTLQKILNDIDPTYTDAHLLIAQIHIQQKQFSKALQSLEIGLSHNFSVRENPLYHLLIGIVQKNQQQYVEAQKSFLNAMNLTGSKFTQESSSNVASPKKYRKSDIGSFTLADKVTLYLELIEVYIQLGESFESERLLQNAMEEFSGTSEEGRLVIANSDLGLQSGNIAKAIELLEEIQPGQSYYIQAKTHLANIYLHQRKDRVAFAKCFKQLVENCPEPESYLMLGEAYMSIQEPDLAVDAYVQALELNPNDSLLASKLGRAYVKTHQYKKAIRYYQEAVENPDHSGLKLDLAELYLKLKQFQNAADILIHEVDQKRIDDNDISPLQLRTKQLLLLARVHEKAGNIALSLTRLKEARDNQYRVQKRVTIDQSGNLQEQNQVLIKICLLIAEQSISLRENDQAVKVFKESLKYSPNDITIMAALARLHLQMNQMDQCKEICSQILHLDSNNEAASVMMADLSFRKMDFESAAYHFSQLLISQPCYWTALARLIEVMRRSGTLSEVASFMQRAEQASVNPSQIAGYNYCKGLYEWYCGNPNGSLRFFNNARRDYEWGQQAVFNMIEICINPDGDLPSTNDADYAADSGEFNDSRIVALRTAERLLKELRPRPGGMDNEALNHRLLHNFLQLSTKQKFQIESSLQDFSDLALKEEYQNLVGPILGMASALIMLKQTQRAKNQLKRIARNTWNFEEAEYLERSWLLLADIYMQSSKYDVAESFVEKVLEHNKSCTKAYEFSGQIFEKMQNYREAAKSYHSAWNCGGKSKPHVGYKLAFNYMKLKKYADAIDVCQQVMKEHPDYTIIKKDILDKCRNNLRS
ncbi:tetratricopeptide repeat protein 21B-like [Eupeodes corollae]|uniref:tetratricopeptide repeat protein 21B-like n=1 Tax=Eupeodes corollae TaxID=290404 RepID=UPI002491306E|nr:tetratricopeptide repeat protein 21B-like [Eupeodes corollae]XP_055902736.1 tetratricopeptide repeat protein 21B-like [Eupeodes corollae]XP_055902737.1 tetratricopeptide repeat protein 21B-like [Eupeodes corollae]XP_055902738.1 tetratricopeptide repeat protein 21B-like [Eupeodes corollae]